MKTLALEYNSQRENLVIPEYGRHIQNLVQFACTIEKDDERQNFAAYIVKLMEQINPSSNDGDELKEKLWKHAVMISDYKLDVKMPDGQPVTKEEKFKKPAQLGYPQKDLKYSHYGHNIMSMIEKAVAMEDKEKQHEFAKIIGSYMKLAYQNWHQEHYASDEMIKADLKRISDGVLTLDDKEQLEGLGNGNSKSHHKKRGRSRSKGRKRRNTRSSRRRR
jgi:hypothetical protein